MTTTSTVRPRPGGFHALRVRSFRCFFLGQTVSNAGTWMQRIAQSWLVLTLTGSPVAVGLSGTLQGLPMLLLGLYGGTLVDRFPIRRVLIVTQSTMGVLAATLAALTLTSTVRIWHVYVLAGLLGAVQAFDTPARQALVLELVPDADAHSAVGLSQASWHASRLVGPAAAGALIAAAGSGEAFALNAASFGAVVAGLLLIRPQDLHARTRSRRSPGQVREGLRYVRSRSDLARTVILAGFVGWFGYNFPVVLTSFSSDVFHVGPGWYGLFSAGTGAGSLLGALVAAHRPHAGIRMLAVTAGLFGVSEAVGALAPGTVSFALMLALVGALGTVFYVTSSAAAQLAALPEMRGRVMGVYTVAFTAPLGGPLVGWFITQVGPRVSMAAFGLVPAAAAAALIAFRARGPGLRTEEGREATRPRDDRHAVGSGVPPRTVARKASGVWPARWWKYLLKLVALGKPSRTAIWVALWSLWASSRLASSITRRSMNSLAPAPTLERVARERVRGE